MPATIKFAITLPEAHKADHPRLNVAADLVGNILALAFSSSIVPLNFTYEITVDGPPPVPPELMGRKKEGT